MHKTILLGFLTFATTIKACNNYFYDYGTLGANNLCEFEFCHHDSVCNSGCCVGSYCKEVSECALETTGVALYLIGVWGMIIACCLYAKCAMPNAK